jgi:2-polyprenyl-3-methyl-5-hydroxy-6-metoxy-1,4-benzoquinol methylase
MRSGAGGASSFVVLIDLPNFFESEIAMNHAETATLERIADEYLSPDPGRQVDRQFQAWTADRLIEWVAGSEVLELGFGDAQWTERLLDRFGHSHVVDASESLLELARDKYGDRIHTYASLFEDFCPEQRFDTVVASFVLEHVEDPVAVLARAAGWLAPGGRVLVAVPHADSLHRRLAVAMGLQARTDELGAMDRRIGHRRVYTITAMEADIEAAGLKVQRRRGLLLKPLPQGMLSGFTGLMLEGFMKLGDELPMEYAANIAFDCVRAGG